MSRIPPVDRKSADIQAAEALRKIDTFWGGEVQLAAVMANSPNLLKAFTSFCQVTKISNLSGEDREIVALEMSRRNCCHYCIPAHTQGSREAGIPDREIAAILDGRDASDPRRRLVQRATQRLCETRGKLTDMEFQGFQDDGLTTENLLDIIGEIAHSTITNFTNGLAQTELDDFLKAVKPAKA